MSPPTDAKAPAALWVALGLAMVPAVTMAFGRFAYALLLPDMRVDLAWTYAQAGAMNAASGAGFVVGAIMATYRRKPDDRKAFLLGGTLTALCLLLSGFSSHFELLIGLRAVGGATGAIAFIAASNMAVATGHHGGPRQAAKLLGIYYAGGGLGIVITAVSLPWLLNRLDWRYGWIALGLLSLLAILAAVPAANRANTRHPAATQPASLRYPPLGPILPQLLSFTLYGAGFITFATYIIDILKNVQGHDTVTVSIFWVLVGLFAIVGAFAWGPLLARLHSGWGSVATMGVTTVGAGIPLFFSGKVAVYLSASLFGIGFLAAVAAMSVFVQRSLPRDTWPKTLGIMTIGFAAGQSLGPVLSGSVADVTQKLDAGLLVSIFVLLAAIFCSALQRNAVAAPSHQPAEK